MIYAYLINFNDSLSTQLSTYQYDMGAEGDYLSLAQNHNPHTEPKP